MRKRRGRGKHIWRNRPEQTRSDAHTSPMQEEVEAGRAKEYSEEQLNYQEMDSPFWTQLFSKAGAEPRLQAWMSAGQSPQPCSTAAPCCLATHCRNIHLRAMGKRCSSCRSGSVKATICHSAVSLSQGSPPDQRHIWINSRWQIIILSYRWLYNFKYYQPHLASENSYLVLNERLWLELLGWIDNAPSSCHKCIQVTD